MLHRCNGICTQLQLLLTFLKYDTHDNVLNNMSNCSFIYSLQLLMCSIAASVYLPVLVLLRINTAPMQIVTLPFCHQLLWKLPLSNQ